MTATERDKKPKQQQAATLLHLIGDTGLEIYNTFHLSEEESIDPDTILQKFQDYCEPRRNVVYERYLFFNRSQQPGEKVDAFVTDLKKLSMSCEFGELTNSLVRDRLVCGIQSPQLKQRMLRDNALTLEKAISLSHAEEQTVVQLQTMDNGAKPVDVVRKIKQSSDQTRAKCNPHISKTDRKQTVDNSRKACRKCGFLHPPRSCPAYGKKCNKCGGMNHFAKCCLSKGAKPRNVHTLDEQDDSQETYWLGALQTTKYVANKNSDAWYVDVGIKGHKVSMKIDTGAEVNVMPLKTWKQINGGSLKKTKVNLKAFGNTDIPIEGVAETEITVGSHSIVDKVYVTKSNSYAVLGLKAVMSLHLISPPSKYCGAVCVKNSTITKETLVTKNKDVFEGLGTYDKPYQITLRDDAVPVIHHPRRVPPALHQQLKAKLHDMVKTEIICPVEEPTDWVNSLVIAQKGDGSLRLCLDPKDLNEYIQREQFVIPTFEQISASLGGKKFFTILDQKDSYWQIKLDKKSSYLTTFNTPFGRFRFLRMPFGINSASEILQKRTFETFGDISGVFCLSDDTLIAASNEEEHDKILNQVIQRARDKGVKFNPKKIQLKKRQVKYMGRLISAEGIQPDPEKIKAIHDMPKPSNVKEVQRLLGMVNFLAPFIPNMSQLTSPLRNLIKKNASWQWEYEQDRSLKMIKETLSRDPVLKLYDPKKKTTIQCDASSEGLGAGLLQDNQPVAFASRSLTQTEKNYAQIEKEMLAIVFAAEHFHQYIYGQKVEVISDHKPLQVIVKKPLHKASPRLQLMMLKLLRYNLEVKYQPGSQMYVADTLSRAIPATAQKSNKAEKSTEQTLRVLSATASAPPGDMVDRVKRETRRDETLSQILRYVQADRWPPSQKNDSKDMKRYKSLQHGIHEEKGVLFYEQRLMIPFAMRREVLEKLHSGHFGLEKTKARARQSIFWPNLTQDIEGYIKKCQTCAHYQCNNVKEPLKPHPVPQAPWKKLGTDIFHYGGKDYLVVVDYFSKYPEITQLDGKTASSVIRGLKPILARHGIPDLMIADNNPFGSFEMTQFAKSWNFKIVTSSPRYPKSNGQAERFVKIMKDIMRKAEDPNAALLLYRNTPITGLEYSPAQMLMGRSLNDLVPAGRKTENRHKYRKIKMQLQQNQAKAQSQYDRTARPRKSFEVGTPVTVRIGPGNWQRAVVTDKCDTPRSFIVTNEDGTELRRNSWFLRHSCHSPVIQKVEPFDESINDNGNKKQRSDPVKSPATSESQVEFSHSPPCQDVPLCNPTLTGTTAVSQTPPPNTTRCGRVVRKPAKYTC